MTCKHNRRCATASCRVRVQLRPARPAFRSASFFTCWVQVPLSPTYVISNFNKASFVRLSTFCRLSFCILHSVSRVSRAGGARRSSADQQEDTLEPMDQEHPSSHPLRGICRLEGACKHSRLTGSDRLTCSRERRRGWLLQATSTSASRLELRWAWPNVGECGLGGNCQEGRDGSKLIAFSEAARC